MAHTAEVRTADVVVVGAGMAGFEAAAELAAGGSARVLVVDGAMSSPVARSSPVAGSSVAGSPVARWRSATPPHYPDHRRHLRAGGRSLAWHGVLLRLERWALADWPAQVADVLRREMYPTVERDLAAWAGCRLDQPRDADAALAARLTECTGAGWQVVARAVRREAGRERGYTPLDRGGAGRGRPEVVSGSVTQVLLDGDRVAGVGLDGGGPGGVAVSAPRVLLAAGTLESTRLVAQARRRPGQEYPLADHLVEGFVARLRPGALPVDGFARWPAEATGRCAVFARTRAAGEEILLDVWTMGEQLPSGASAVRFPRAGTPPWTAVVTAGLGAADDEVLAAGRRRLEGVWAAVCAAGRPRWPAFLARSRSFAEATAALTGTGGGQPVPYAWPLGTVDHEGSSLPLGSELDDRGRVRDVEGLWVTGPAAFPRPGAANPSLTTLALARRTARLLAGA